MAYSLKKLWAAMAVSLVTATSFANAAFQDGYVYDASCCPPSCADACGCDWWVDVDYLYMQFDQDGLAIGDTSFSNGDFDAEERKVHNVKNQWDSGVRVGIGADLGQCDQWDVGIWWTWFNTDAKKHVGVGVDEEFHNAWARSDSLFDDFVDEVHSKWKVQLDLLDVELGREFCVSPCLVLRPFVGIRAAWIDQKLDILAFGEGFEGDDTITTFQDTHAKSKFEGVGLRAGLDSEWDVGCGFSVYGTAAASVVYGEFKNKYRNFAFRSEVTTTDPSDVEDVDTAFDSQHDNFNACRAITDAALGVRWKDFWCCDTMKFTLDIGWEHHMFFDQNRLESPFSPDSDHDVLRGDGDLCLQGLVVSARIDF